MKKFFPLIKVIILMNICGALFITFLVYFNVRPPGMSGGNRKINWTPEILIFLYVTSFVVGNAALITGSFSATKNIKDLRNRFSKVISFKLLNKIKFEDYLRKNNFSLTDVGWEKQLDQKRPIKLMLSATENRLVLKLDSPSVGTFQSNKEYCLAVDRIRKDCPDIVGDELS